MKTKIIRKTITLRATPKEVYDVLMNSKKHSKLIHSKAEIKKKVGEIFTAFNKSITGTNLELTPEKKIVQSWRDNEWPKGFFSVVTFLIEEKNKGTKLTIVHSGVPANNVNNVKEAWIEYYLEPLKGMFAKT